MKSNYKRRMMTARDTIVAHIPEEFRKGWREIHEHDDLWWLDVAATLDVMAADIEYGRNYVGHFNEVQATAADAAVPRSLPVNPRTIIEALNTGLYRASLALGPLCKATGVTMPPLSANDLDPAIREVTARVESMMRDLAYLRDLSGAREREIERLKAANAALTAIVLTHAADAAGVDPQPIKEVIQ